MVPWECLVKGTSHILLNRNSLCLWFNDRARSPEGQNPWASTEGRQLSLKLQLPSLWPQKSRGSVSHPLIHWSISFLPGQTTLVILSSTLYFLGLQPVNKTDQRMQDFSYQFCLEKNSWLCFWSWARKSQVQMSPCKQYQDWGRRLTWPGRGKKEWLNGPDAQTGMGTPGKT